MFLVYQATVCGGYIASQSILRDAHAMHSASAYPSHLPASYINTRRLIFDARSLMAIAIFHAIDAKDIVTFPLLGVGFSVFKQALIKQINFFSDPIAYMKWNEF